MEFLEAALYPLISALRLMLEFFHSLTGNYGISIIALAAFVAAVTFPLTRYAHAIELKDKALQEAMAPKIRLAKENFKGERQFNEIEKIYQEHDYHPIKSLKSVAGLAFQLPFLISCLLLLINYPPLAGESFLFLQDLGQSDKLLGGVNVLPFFMTSITLSETAIKQEMTREGKIKFALVTLAILTLVYPLPSAVVLYWTASNAISFGRTAWQIKLSRLS